MARTRWITVAVLVLVAAAIVVALMMEATSGAMFRAEDHANYAECIAAIPAEWEMGSLDRSGAEDACHYVHRPGMRRSR